MTEWVIWDASSFYIVNRLSPGKVASLGEAPPTGSILELLLSELESPKRADVRENLAARETYLRCLMELAGLKGQYLGSRAAFRDSRYAESLDEALALSSIISKEETEIYRKLLPVNANPANALYLPLELAEAAYLQDAYGVEGKFGPKSEQFFDVAINLFQDLRDAQYVTIRSPNPPEGIATPYLNDGIGCSVVTTDNAAAIRQKLKNPAYRTYVEQFLPAFAKAGECLEETALRVVKSLKQVV